MAEWAGPVGLVARAVGATSSEGSLAYSNRTQTEAEYRTKRGSISISRCFEYDIIHRSGVHYLLLARGVRVGSPYVSARYMISR